MKMSIRLLPLLTAVIVTMTQSAELLAQQTEPLFGERFSNVFDPNSRTYYSLQGQQGDIAGQQPFTSFGASHFIGDIDDSISLFSGNIMVNNNGNPAGTFGAQQRWMRQLPVIDNSILGAGLYMDYTQSRYDNLFQQVNLNLELLTESSWVARFNGYFPVGRIQASTGHEQNLGGTSGQLNLIGDTVGFGGINRTLMDVGLMGTDLEFGRKFFDYRMEAYGGYYNWNGPLAGFTNGVKGGVRGYITNNLSGNVNISHDGFFGTNVSGGLTYFFGGSGGSRPMSFRNLMTLPAMRQQQVTIGNFTRQLSTFVPAHDSATGDVLHMYFVKEAGTGTGTQTNASNINSVLADTNFGTGSAMVLLDANGNLTSPITLNHDRQQIIGGGSTGTANVDFSLALGQAPGTSVIHLSGLGGRPVLMPPAGNAVTLTNQNVVSGFTIDGSGGITNGIVGTPGASNTIVNDMLIKNVTGTGIKIQPSTNTTVSNTTFQNNGQDLLLNAANSKLTNITSTGAINGSLNLGGSGGDITGNTLISGVTITNAGGFGGILLNNAQNGSITNLTNVNISNGTGSGLTVTNSQTGSIYNLTNVDILNVGGTGTLLKSSNGAFNVDATSSITNASVAAFAIDGGAINVTNNSTINQSQNAPLLSVTNNHTGTVNFTAASTLSSNNGNGMQFNNANGTYNLLGTNSMTAGDAGIDILASTGTFVFHNPLINNTASGTGVNISGAAITTFNGLDITTNSGTGFKVVNGGLTTVNGTANVNATSQAAIDISGTPLAAVFTNVTSTGSATDGILLNNASGTFGASGITTVTNATGSGINILNSSGLTSTFPNLAISTTGSNGVTLDNAGIVNLTGGTINGTAGDGIHSADTNLTATGLNIGGVSLISGDGIEILNNSATSRTVNLSNNTIKGSASGISSSDNGNSGNLLLTLDGNSLQSINGGSLALSIKAGGLNSTIIQSMNGGTVIGGTGGGVLFDQVTFDASGAALSGTQVNGGNWTIGTAGVRVQGDGLRFNAPTGDLNYGSLNVANNSGTGLYVDTKTLGTTFSLSNTSGSVDTTSGAALFLDPLTTNLTFGTVSSTNSSTNGITLDTVSGQLNIGTATINNATTDGFNVSNSTAAVTTGQLNVNGAVTGVNLFNNTAGSFTVSGVGGAGAGGTIQNVTDRGVLAVNNFHTSLNNMVVDATNGSRGVGVLSTSGTNAFSLTNSTVTGGTEQAVGIGADLAGVLNATVTGNTLIGTGVSDSAGGFGGITSAAGLKGGTLNLAFSNNTLSSANSAGALISSFNPLTSTTGGTVTVTDFANNVVTTSNAGGSSTPLTGGIRVNGVTFDADLSTAGIQTVNGGTLTIGSPGTPGNIVGDGLQLNDVSGALAFTTVNIGNDNGTGLYVNTKVNNTTFSLSNTGGSISTTNGSALFLDPLTANLSFSSVTATGGSGNGIELDTVAGTVNLGTVNVTNMLGNGVLMNNSSASVTAGTVTVNNVASGMVFGNNTGGGFSATGVTNLTGLTGTGVDLRSAAGTYNFAGLNITTTGATTGLDFRNSNVLFTSANTNITGSGNAGSIGVDLSGSTNPNGANSATANITLAGQAGQTAIINNVGTGVSMGNVLDGSAGANFIYGNQTPLNSGSQINAIASGLTLDTRHLISSNSLTQGQYNFKGVSFTGTASFQISPDYLFVGSSSAGGDTGSSVANRISLAELLALDASPANLDNKTIVLVNDNAGAGLDLGANTLILGNNTILDSFGNGQTFTVGTAVPVNVILDTVVSPVVITDPNGAATLKGSLDLVKLGNGDTVQNLILDGGLNGIVGTGVAGVDINHLTIQNSSASGIALLNTTGTIGLNNLTLSNIGTAVSDNGITLQNAGTVTVANSSINTTSGDGIYSSNTDLTATGLTIGTTGTVSGIGIEVGNSGSQRTVDISNNTITANGSAIKTTDVGVAGELLLTLDGNTLQSNGGSIPALDVTGSGLNSTIVQSMFGGTIVGGTGGGAQFSQVTFDASGRSLSGQQVVAGDWTIGTTGSRVQGAGLRLINPTGDLKFGALNIANNNGAGLLVNTKGLGTTFTLGNTSGTVDTTNGAALDLDPLTTSLTFDTVKSVGSSNVGVNVDTVAGTIDINNLIISNSASTGAIFNNSAGLTTTIQSVDITNVGNDGIGLISAGTFSVLGGTIDSTFANGINDNDTNLTVSGVNIGATSVAGNGIQIINAGNARTVNLNNNTIKSTGNALYTTDTGTANELLLSLDGNSYESTGSLALSVTGSALNSTIIQSMNGGTVVGNGLGGGAIFQQVTFDASGTSLSGTQVSAGDWTIGTTTNRVSGDGLQFYDPTGKLAFGNLNIANNIGVGLTVDTKGLGTTFDLQTTGGTIDTTGGAALFLDPLSANIHFNTVSSTGSFTNGATLDTVSGTVLIDQLNISTANQNGLVINNSSGLTTTVTSMTINGVGNNLTHAGVVLTDAGTVNLNGGSIDSSTGDGIHSSDTNLTATSLLIGNVGSIAGDGIEIVNNGGLHTVNLSGNTIIGAASGISTKDSGLNVGELLLTLDNNTLSSVDAGSKALEVLGNGLNTTIIQSMNGGMILANGTGGGAHFSRVTFDGSGRSLSGTQAAGGDWTVGSGVGVIGDGMRFDGPSGDLQFGNLTIKNTSGTGLFVDTKTLGTTFALGNTGGSITTSGGAALNLDPALVTSLTVNMNFSGVTSTNSATNGITLDTIGGTLNLGNVNVTNATGSGLWMDKTAATVTANTVTVNGAADGLTFGNNQFGSFAATGATNLTNITGNGVNLTGAAGSYQFAGLTVGTTGAATGLNFRNSNVTFQSANTSITGDGTAGSIGVDLSGSQNPNGANSTTPNIQLANALGQTALINNVETGVRLGSVADGSAGANFIYGNQTPLNSGSQINVIVGGVTLDAANLVSTGAYTQGRYEFKGVSFTGNTNFASAPGASYIFVGQTSAGADDGSTPTDRYSIAQLIALGAAALDNKTVVLVNEGVNIDEGASTLTLGDATIVDTFGNGRSFTTSGLIIPQNVIVDTFGGAVTYNDPFANGAATITGTGNVITLGNNDTIQNILISGGTNGISGNSISSATINNVNISGSSQNGIDLTNTTGTQTLTALTIDSVGTNGINLSSAGTVSISGATTINNTGADGIHSSDTNLTVAAASIGGIGGITGDAIEIVNTGNARSVNINNSTLFGTTAGLKTTDAGVAGELLLNLDGNSYGASGAGNLAVNVTGSGLNSTIVQSMNGGTIFASGGSGGVLFNRVTFDGSGTALTGTTVTAGNWSIGSNGIVTGNGLEMDNVSGNLAFGTLDITNDSGTGLLVDTKTLGTTFSLSNTGGTITTTNGAAVFLDPLTTNMTFDAVNSTGSSSTGITLDTVAGNFTVNGGTISGTTGSTVSVLNSSAASTFNDMTLNGGSSPAVMLNGNGGAVTFHNMTMTRPVGGSTAFDIDSTNASTAKITIDGTSSIGTNPGTAFLIGAGARDIDASALAITNNNTTTGPVISIAGQSGGLIQFGTLTNSGSTASNVINTTGQTGGTTSFGNVLITGYGNAAADTAVSLTGSAGSVTFSDLDITTTNGSGLNLGGITFNGGASPTINATGGSALFANGTTMSGGTQTFASITDAGGNYGINMANITGTTNFTTVDISGNSVDGIFLNKAGTVVLNGGSINNTLGNGINTTDTNLTVSGLNIGTGVAIGGNGISIKNTGAAHTVHMTNNTITAVGKAIRSTDSGTAGELVLTLDGNTIQSTGDVAMNITGGLLHSTIISSMNTNTVIGNGVGGGVIFNQVTFDGSGAALLGTQVTAGDWTVGTVGNRVSGDAMVFSDPTGDLAFGALNIANDNGTGLYVNTKGLGTTFSLSNTSGSINTTNGAALFLDPLTTNMSLNSVSSTNSGTNGVWFDGVSGNFTVTGTTTSSNAGGHGILIENSDGTFNFNDIDVDTPGADGIHINNTPGATINFNGTTTIQSTTGDGIDLSSAGGGVTFGATNISGAGADGINLTNATGSYAFGATTINGFETNSVGINFAGAAADATFGATDIGNGGFGTAIDLSSTTGNHNISFATGSNIHNVALGVELSSGHTNATTANANFAFGDSNAGNGLGSFISATTTVNAVGLNPLSGTYNFDDVNFTGTANLPSTAGSTLFVSATATNGVGDGSFSNPYSVLDADAITTAGKTFVFLDGTYDFNTLNGGNAFTLSKNQNVEGLDNGHTVAYGTAQPVNVIGNLGATGGTASRTSSLSITDSAAAGIFDLLGGNSLLDITLSGSASTTYLVGANGGAGGFDNTAGINLNGVTMSNAAGSATAMQFTNLTGNMTATGNNINLSAGRLLDIDGGTATYSFTKGTQPDVGATPGVLTAGSMRVRNTTGGSVALNGATLSSTGTLVTLDNNDATFSFLNNTFTGGAGSTLFDIDTTTGGSTTALTFGNTNSITQTQGRIANIGGGARNIDLSAFNFTNTGTTATSVINSVGQTGGTIKFGNINIAGYNNAAGTAVNLQGSGGSVTFGDLDIVTTNGAGLSVGAITFDGGASPTVSANGGTALKLNGTTLFGGGQTFDVTATNTGAGNAGVNINNVVGNTALSAVNINGTGAEGILINNSGQVNIGNGSGPTSNIDGTVGDAVKTTNTDTFIDTVLFGSVASIGGNGYTALMSNGVNHTLDITNSGFSNIVGKGVAVTNSGGGHTVFTMTSTGVNASNNAVDLRKTGAGALDVGMGNNAFTSSAGFGLYVDGSVGAGILSVTENSTNLTNGATGGQIFETVTFDANTSLAGIQQVSGGATTIGPFTSGDGMRLNNVRGDIAFTALNITNDNGTGLYIRDAGGKGGSFAFSNTSGSITTTNGAAMDIDPVTMNSTFSTVSSTNANGQGISTAANGINLNTVTGTVTINGGSITGAQGDSFVVTGGDALVTYQGDITANTAGQSAVTINGGNTGTVTFNTGIISATNGTGLQFNNADGTYNFNGTTSLAGGNAGIDIVNGSSGGFTFGTGTSIISPTGTAFNMDSSTANVTYSGDITQANNALLVLLNNESAGTVTFQTGTLNATNGTGILMQTVGAAVNFNGVTTLNGGDAGVDIIAGSTGTFTFGTGTSITSPSGTAFNVGSSTANVTYSGNITQANNASLVSISSESAGTVTFDTGTLSASNGNGIALTNVDGNVNFNGTTTLTGGSVIDIETNSDGTFVFGTGTSITNGTSNAFRYGNGAGNVTYNGNITQTNATNKVVFITGQTGGTITFQTGTLTGSAGTGMSFNNVDGNVNFLGTTSLTDTQITIGNNSAGTFNFASGTSLTNSAGLIPFSVDNSSANITYSGNLTHSNAITAGVFIQNESAGTITFNTGTINITNGTGIQLDNVDSIVNFNGTTTLNGGDAGVDILNGSAGTFTFGSGTTITNPTGSGFNEDTSTANVTYNGTITKNNNSQNAVRVNGKTGGTTALNGQITASTSTGNAINLLNNTGGVINFNNTSGSTSNITTTSGNAFNFTGGGTLNLAGNNYVMNSTSGTAFNATAGTVSAIGTGNTLTSTTGTALNVSGATIGVGDLTFKSISANGAVNGIVLNNTGALGGLIVTGNGNTSVGGDGSGGLIQNTTGAGISLTNTRDVSLTNLNISSTGGSGIDGTGVTNFTYNNGTITGAGNAGFESAIAFNQNPTTGNNIAGTLTIDKNVFTNAFYSGVDVQAGNGTVSNATITNNTITNPGFSGVNFVGTGSVGSVFNLTKALIDNNNITGSGANGVQINIGNNAGGTGAIAGIAGDASNKISITNNSVSLDTTGTNAIVINNAGGNSGSRDQTNFDISFNTLGSSSIGTVILIGNNGYSTMTGTVTNNTITATHTPLLGGGNGIGGGNGAGSQTSAATPDLTLTVENNTISGTDGNGILLVGRGATGIARFKIDGNNVGAPVNATGTARNGIRIDAGNASSVDDAVYLNIFNNISAGSNGANGIGVRKQGSTASINDFGLYDAAGGPVLPASPTNTDIQTFINALNPAGNGTDIINGSNYLRDTTQAPP